MLKKNKNKFENCINEIIPISATANTILIRGISFVILLIVFFNILKRYCLFWEISGLCKNRLSGKVRVTKLLKKKKKIINGSMSEISLFCFIITLYLHNIISNVIVQEECYQVEANDERT
jgi:hypothetical protein